MRALITILILCVSLAAFAESVEEGYASWYGGKFQGRPTASGEIFDTEQMTAAHKTLAFGTIVKVINLENNKTTVVRINDRGPFVESRIIDLSRAAASEIEMLEAGVARVKLEILEVLKLNYTIQAGCFSKPENAYKLREKLEARKLTVAFEKTTNDLLRVLVTGITSETIDSTTEILKSLKLTGLIVRAVTEKK